MVVQVGVHALRNRRNQLRRTADRIDGSEDAATVCLLLFYAAECGLKAQLMRRHGYRSSSDLEPTHDLRKLAKQLRLSRAVADRLDRIQSCRLHPPGLGSVAMADLHQVWRYGAKLNAEDQKEAHSMLRALISWCEQARN